MKELIDTIAIWLVNLKVRKDTIDQDTTTFLKRGNNLLIVWTIFFGSIFIYMYVDIYLQYVKLWWALIPMLVFFLILFVGVITNAYRDKLKNRNRGGRMKLVGFNMDFNERVLQRVYNSLTRYEYLDENLTGFQDFYNVLVLDFDEHDSALYFICTQPQLKYILKKLKELKNGSSYVSFERS